MKTGPGSLWAECAQLDGWDGAMCGWGARWVGRGWGWYCGVVTVGGWDRTTIHSLHDTSWPAWCRMGTECTPVTQLPLPLPRQACAHSPSTAWLRSGTACQCWKRWQSMTRLGCPALPGQPPCLGGWLTWCWGREALLFLYPFPAWSSDSCRQEPQLRATWLFISQGTEGRGWKNWAPCCADLAWSPTDPSKQAGEDKQAPFPHSPPPVPSVADSYAAQTCGSCLQLSGSQYHAASVVILFIWSSVTK